MMSMSIPYELNGRIDQKRRTRDALVAAARELVAQRRDADGRRGRGDGVDLSRHRLSVLPESTRCWSRPTRRRPPLPCCPTTHQTTRRLDSTSSSTRLLARSSIPRRNSARCFDSRSKPTRSSARNCRCGKAGRSSGSRKHSRLSAREMSEAEIHRLTLAIRSATGIEALVWLTDVAGLSRDDATELMRWSARALLQSALADKSTGPRD